MSKFSERRLVIACGGTGGHLFPGIAVAESWTAGGGEVVLLISEKQIDALAAEGYGHLRFEKMPSVALPRLLSLQMPVFLAKFVGSLFACRRLLKTFRADAVLGMGGFTSAAPLLAGKLLGLPTFIHESNAIPGRANKLNARFARTILVGFEECAKHFASGQPVEVVGTPVRPSVARRPSREEAASFFGISPEKKTIMVMGGSQGARRVNELVAASLAEFEDAGLQVLHISGPTDYETVKPMYDAHPDAGCLVNFCSEIQHAYAAADLAICRSGASTLTELAFYGLPSVLIPYPFAADDHQTRNAEIFSVPGGAECWSQEGLSEKEFSRKIISLLTEEESLAEMEERMRALAIPDASDRVCEVIANQVKEGNG
ncbi:MAG: undecaprenyldiphospho-muramoylpentapeptide beta-N-acetylglucosaminyltransferase [Verrucomicrobiales bacterium]|nr:undecaprenyldiphospho-muramoylpentapeptide beta-N-acetylglucosaminyltransferase [Verrucomicrobiales bacterium]